MAAAAILKKSKIAIPQPRFERFRHNLTLWVTYNGLSIHGLGLVTINLPAKFDVSNSTHCEHMKGDTKYRKLGGLG